MRNFLRPSCCQQFPLAAVLLPVALSYGLQRRLPLKSALLLGFLAAACTLIGSSELANAQSFANNKKYNPGLYLAYGGGTNFSPIAGKSYIQGVSRLYNWRDIETSEGVYDFSAIHADLDQLEALGDKRLIISFQPTVFGPGLPTVPEYITSNPIYGDAGATGGYYGVYDRPNGGYYTLFTSELVKDRQKAFVDALAAEFDHEPLVEQIFGGLMGETAYAGPPNGNWSANVHANTWKEMITYAANAFQETSVSAAVNFGQFDKSRYANWAADNGIVLTSPDMWMDYTNPSRGEPLWYGPEGIYDKQQQLSGRTPTMSIASNGSWDESWLYDGVHRRDPTAQDFIDYSQSSGIFAAHPDPNVQGHGTNASYLIGIGYDAVKRNQMTAAVEAYVNGGGTFAKLPDVIEPSGLLNSGFEAAGSNNTSPIIGWGSVAGWQSDSPATKSGIQLASDFGREGADGDWIGYLDAQDPSIWNTTDQTIISGAEYEATLALRQGVNNRTATAEVTLYYDDNGVRNPIVTEDINADDYWFWSDRSLSFNADDFPAAIGKHLGIEIKNVGAYTGLLRFDQVRLDQMQEQTGLAGDFNLDGTVNGADLPAWQGGFGTTADAKVTTGDANWNSSVDGGDFLAWQRGFGTNVSSPSSTSAIPEPASLVLLYLGAAATLLSRCRTLVEFSFAA